jgi:hypothetical protein
MHEIDRAAIAAKVTFLSRLAISATDRTRPDARSSYRDPRPISVIERSRLLYCTKRSWVGRAGLAVSGHHAAESSFNNKNCIVVLRVPLPSLD